MATAFGGHRGRSAAVLGPTASNADASPTRRSKSKPLHRGVQGAERARDSVGALRELGEPEDRADRQERYISYGMYEVYDIAGLLKEARGAPRLLPATPALDAVMTSYIEAYQAVARVLNRLINVTNAQRMSGRHGGGQEAPRSHGSAGGAVLAQRGRRCWGCAPIVRDADRQEVAAKDEKGGGWSPSLACRERHSLGQLTRRRPVPKLRPASR